MRWMWRNAIFDLRKADMPPASTIPGRKVSQGSYSAFVPAPLPPELEWTPRPIGALSDADRLVGRLAGEGTLVNEWRWLNFGTA